MDTTELLVIDDDPVSILLSKFFLEKSLTQESTVKITTFTCAYKGFEYVKNLLTVENEKCLQYRILLDLNMPGINGWEFLDLLRTIDPNHKVKVVIHSSSNNKEDKDKAKDKKHVEYYLPKPMTHLKASNFVELISNDEKLAMGKNSFNSNGL